MELVPKDTGATHALAHVMEMEGRQDEGIKFMSETIENWKVCEMRFYEIAPFQVVKFHFLSRQLNVCSLQKIVSFVLLPLQATAIRHGDRSWRQFCRL